MVYLELVCKTKLKKYFYTYIIKKEARVLPLMRVLSA